MIFIDIAPTGVVTKNFTSVKQWHTGPSALKIKSHINEILKSFAIGSGSIKSGTKFAKDNEGNAAPYAEIFCYLQSDSKLELVAQTVSDVNGLWELKKLNKKYLYTIVARYKGFENTIMSNIYPV